MGRFLNQFEACRGLISTRVVSSSIYVTRLSHSFLVPSSQTRGRRRNRSFFPVASLLVLLPEPFPFSRIFPVMKSIPKNLPYLSAAKDEIQWSKFHTDWVSVPMESDLGFFSK